MLGPNAISSGRPPTRSAAARCPASTISSAARLVAKAPPRLALDATRQAVTASTNSPGTCEPPGPSRWATPSARAGKRARTAPTSSSGALTAPKLADGRRQAALGAGPAGADPAGRDAHDAHLRRHALGRERRPRPLGDGPDALAPAPAEHARAGARDRRPHEAVGPLEPAERREAGHQARAVGLVQAG